MTTTVIKKAILILAGLAAAAIGTAILFFPVTFYTGYGIDVGGNVSLLNELKAPGIALVTSGLFIAAGAVVTRLTPLSAFIAAFLYLSFGLSRLVSITLDGMPADGLVQAAAIEIVLGLACLWVVARERRVAAAA